MTPYDRESFSAGQQAGARVAAVIARLAAVDLMRESRWWNRWRHRLMARALVAHAEEMEAGADEASSGGAATAGIRAAAFRAGPASAIALR